MIENLPHVSPGRPCTPFCCAAQVVLRFLLRLARRLQPVYPGLPAVRVSRQGQRAISAKLAVKPEETVMLQTVSRLLPELALLLMTAVATHLVMSFAQTLMHYKLGHHPMGGKFFRNHINFHHTYYSQDHLVSRTYLSDEDNNTPFFFIPVFLVGGCTYLVLPVDLFVVQVVACAASFYAHVFFDKEYHVEGSRLQRFAWFRRKQELHFVHHRHANSNFAVIHFFWDRILGTYRMPDAGQT
jgi:sterol desaturase/sphingolipid hydroxylase (fatty acid hydroxylase superfamily)